MGLPLNGIRPPSSGATLGLFWANVSDRGVQPLEIVGIFAAKAVERPEQHAVELAAAGVLEQGGNSWRRPWRCARSRSRPIVLALKSG